MKWSWHYEDFGALLRGPELRAVLKDAAEKGKAAAEAIAPRGDDNDWLTEPVPSPHPGLYAESFETSEGTEALRSGGVVGCARLTNTAPYATAVEYGNGRGQAHHVLSRALDAMRE